MLSLYLLIISIVAAQADPFVSFVRQHEKEYDSVHEYFKRKDIFEDNLRFIKEHNAKIDSGFKLRANKFADLTWDEFKNNLIGNKPAKTLSIPPKCILQDKVLTNSFDWRVAGAVTPVKNQGACGSCWSFSTTGALEGLNFIQTGELVSLSEQHLVSCDSVDDGCNGGLMENAFDFVAKYGICSEQDYPYTSGDGQEGQCRPCKSVVDIGGYASVPSSNETALQLAVNRQPVSIALQADHPVFQFYHTGVMDSDDCGEDHNHAVLITGWGIDQDRPN